MHICIEMTNTAPVPINMEEEVLLPRPIAFSDDPHQGSNQTQHHPSQSYGILSEGTMSLNISAETSEQLMQAWAKVLISTLHPPHSSPRNDKFNDFELRIMHSTNRITTNPHDATPGDLPIPDLPAQLEDDVFLGIPIPVLSSSELVQSNSTREAGMQIS